MDWSSLADDYDRIRDHIEATIPGFDRYNERVRQPDGFSLPNSNREGRFDTDTGKAKFTVHAIESMGLAADEYLMMTIRSHDQYNTTIYGMDDPANNLVISNATTVQKFESNNSSVHVV